VVLVKVSEHKPREARPLADVRADIVKRIEDDAAETRSEAFAKGLEAKLDQGESLESVATGIGGKVETAAGTGRTGLTVDAALVAKVFGLPRPKENASTRDLVELRRGEYALVELTKVTDGDPKSIDAAGREAVRNQLVQQKQAVESRALLDALRSSTEVLIAEERM
jgi:peptidyl-prolyl cis-trans isomerase D